MGEQEPSTAKRAFCPMEKSAPAWNPVVDARVDSQHCSQLAEQGLHLLALEPLEEGNEARLFLGTQKAAQDRSLLRRERISRIVCVGTPAFHQGEADGGQHEGGNGDDANNPDCGRNGRRLVYLEVPVLDLPSENLLGRLDACVSFIEDGLRRGEGLLVNCVFAQSRSAAVVVAYLMKQRGMTFAQGVEKVRETQPTVHINPGFQAQLALYADLGCRLPGSSQNSPTSAALPAGAGLALRDRRTELSAGATYRWFLFTCGLTDSGKRRIQHPGGGHGPPLRAHHDKGGLLSREGRHGTAPMEGPRAAESAAAYRCKACRTPLFSESSVIDHLHPIVLAASDSVYASFSRHGDGSSWLAARDAASAAAAAAAASAGDSGGNVGGERAEKGRPQRSEKGRPQRSVVRRVGGSVKNSGPGADMAPSAGRGCCTSVFTEPLEWVGILEGHGSGYPRGPAARFGKIRCPGRKGHGGATTTEGAAACGSKLGAWSLDGTACSCGRVVKPALQFTLSRIERARPA